MRLCVCYPIGSCHRFPRSPAKEQNQADSKTRAFAYLFAGILAPDSVDESYAIWARKLSIVPATSDEYAATTAELGNIHTALLAANPPPAESSDSEIEDADAGKSNPMAVGTPENRLPPIFVNLPDNWCTLISIAGQLAPTLISKLTGKFLRITVQSDDEYCKLAQFLRHEGVEYKSFMLKSDGPLKLLIRGLPTSTKIANDEGADEQRLTRAFRAALPALQKLSHPDDKACEIFQAYLTLQNWLNYVSHNSAQLSIEQTCNQSQLFFGTQTVCAPKFMKIRTAGGSAIYCKSNFVQSRAPLPGIQYMDATAIEIKINNFSPLRVVSAYARFCVEINRKFPEKDFLKILNSEHLSTKWEEFRFLLKNKPLPIPKSPSNEHLEVAIGRLGENISEALKAASKLKFKTASIKLPLDIRSKIQNRYRVWRFWQRSRDHSHKNELRTISNEIASDIRHLSRAR
ncbi:hypothetical protein TNCV_1020501 [Trichonephila clavipes]|nr:hypothetical protein TNCV_1020501 [Trichonephila clavipes]